MTIEELYEELNSSVSYLIAENDYLQTPSKILDPLKEDLKNWDEVYLKYRDKFKRTPEVTAIFKATRDSSKKHLSDMKQYFKHGIIDLRPEDRLNLGIHEDKHPSTVPVPAVEIALNVLLQQRAAVKIQASDESLPGFNHETIINRENTSINVYYVIKEVGDDTEPKPSEYVRSKRFSSATFTFYFELEDIQKTAWLVASVANHKNQEGPLSKPIKIVIPN